MELKARLNKVSIRTLRDDTEIILADGSKLKGTIRKIYSTVLRMPRTAIENWKKYFGGLKNIFFFDNIRSLEVKSSLEGMIKRTMRDKSQRVLGVGNKVKGAMQSLIDRLNNIPKKDLRRWNKTVDNIKNKRLFDNARSAKLQNYLDRIEKRTMKDASERLKRPHFPFCCNQNNNQKTRRSTK